MCGICGFTGPERHSSDILARMSNAIVHRGPDGESEWRKGPFAGAMRRLSINDLENGGQPFFSQSGDAVVFYNGEIYNSPFLRKALELRGIRFRSQCDGEVIAHLYDEHGLDLFDHLDGMYGLCIWDQRRKRLVLARDPAGEKPLYFADLGKGNIAFASEISSLRAHPSVDLSIDLQAVWDFPTFLWVPEPNTIHKGIKALMPGQMLIAENGGVRLKQIKLTPMVQGPVESPIEAARETRRCVEDAIESRLLSDVPVGAFLSSGLDSSIVCTVAQRRLGNLRTYSIGFENLDDPYHGKADESAAAKSYASILGTQHTEIRIREEDFRDLLSKFGDHAGQPFGVSSGLGILAVARQARQDGTKVLLSGDGADEAFGGYSWYAHLAAAALPPAQPPPPGRELTFQNVGLSLPQRIEILAGYPPHIRAWAWHYYAAEAEKAGLFNRDLAETATPSPNLFSRMNGATDWSPLDYIENDRRLYLPNEMMTKMDRMAMAYSIEGRAPFVARVVQDHARRLGYRHMVAGETLKIALREAFSDLLPDEVTQRPKHGFNVPIDAWLKGRWSDLVDETFAPSSKLSQSGLLAPGAAGNAARLLADPSRLNGHTIFCFIMLNKWLEKT